ncbi:MAG: RIP metalloprotease RseP [Paracoccaceae bacterium]
MDLLNSIPVIGPILFWVLPFIIVLSIVVAIHELGHLMVGRWCGIKAEVYSIGFGKVIWSRTDSHGTVWQIAALPFGGFVKFLGDMDPASAGQVDDAEMAPEDRKHAFHNAALWKRAATVIAGPMANFILSIIIFFGIALYTGKASDEPVIAELGALSGPEIGLAAGDRILQVGDTRIETFADVVNSLTRTNGEVTPVRVEREGDEIVVQTRYAIPAIITSMRADGKALAAGMRPGDTVTAVDGAPIATARQLQLLVADAPHNEALTFTVDRDEQILDITFTPDLVSREHPETLKVQLVPTMGVGLPTFGGLVPETVSAGMFEAAEAAVMRVWRVIADTVIYIKQMLFHGADTSHLSGPIGIAKHSSNAASQGLVTLIQFVAFVSTAIGLMNLFPIPVLDGGHLVFYAIEALRGKPTHRKIVEYGSVAGLSLLLLLMVFVTFNNDLGLGAWLSQN